MPNVVPNLKIDLLNQLNNQKFFEEVELVRLANDPNMNYKEKIDNMQYRLSNINTLNNSIGLVNVYFQDQPAPAANAPTQASGAHPGQTHGE